jgi:ureidoglycolate lyase
MQTIDTEPLTVAAFAPFGEVLSANGRPSFLINNDKCGRYHDLARPEIAGDDDGQVALSVFRAEAYKLPYILDMMERHPLGSQTFVPMGDIAYLVIAAPDENQRPGCPKAFLAAPGQGVNYHRNIWHGVLTPLDNTADFLVIDRIGNGNNLEEFFFDTPYLVGGES